MNQKVLIAIAAVVIIAGGFIYYFMGSGYNYGPVTSPANTSVVTPNPQGAYPVSIKNFAFSPAVLNIEVGKTVIWTNYDSVSHPVSGTGFESGDLPNGRSYSYTFMSAGTFDYICSTHPRMQGQIVVK